MCHSSIANKFTPALSGSSQTFKKNLRRPFILKEKKFEVMNKEIFMLLLPRMSDILPGVVPGCAM